MLKYASRGNNRAGHHFKLCTAWDPEYPLPDAARADAPEAQLVSSREFELEKFRVALDPQLRKREERKK